MKSLNGSVALVTGAGQGIGKAIALELANHGATVIVNDMNIDLAEGVCSEIKSNQGDAIPVKADVSAGEEVDAMVKQIVVECGKIDILINNVGISPKKDGDKIPLLDIEEKEWEHVLNVNLKSVFLCTQAVAKEMAKQKKGQIVNISSMSAKSANTGPAAAHYCASKAGVNNLTIASARELISHGIRVNAVAPGVAQTPMRVGTSGKYNEILLNQIPMGRFGFPEEIARAVVFLASEESSYITGEILDVNGGCLMD
jgi:3-oxoacyl-[acyl-carrier protein] reductase